MDLAAALQKTAEDAIVHVARGLQEATGEEDLCFHGGVALNCLANTRIIDETGFKRVHVASSPSDAGTTVGAALSLAKRAGASVRQSTVGQSPYLGPEYDVASLGRALEEAKLDFTEPSNVCAAAAELLANGDCLAWFQGRAEHGPRALGNRCIIADPRSESVRDRLNNRIKRREWYRPFGAAILEDAADQYFEVNNDSPHMSFAVRVRRAKVAEIPAVVARDGSSRIQMVSELGNERFYELISQFYRITGLPLLLSTSFNVVEPMVCTPEQAISTFVRSELDALVMGPYLVESSRSNRASD
jgi:carbamoyltransferase